MIRKCSSLTEPYRGLYTKKLNINKGSSWWNVPQCLAVVNQNGQQMFYRITNITLLIQRLFIESILVA
jgi:hypothetical protein